MVIRNSQLVTRVKLYALLRDVAGTDELEIPFQEGETVDDFLRRLCRKYPKLLPYINEVAVAEGDEYRRRDDVIAGGFEIALLPPVSGGSARFLTYTTIRQDEIMQSLYHPEAGAVLTFLGTVRAESEKRPIAYLDYEAHEVLAEKEMEKIVSEAKNKWEILELALVHRLGRIPVGETSLLIGIATRHRDEAYPASRFILEAVKHRVPIWKKEVFTDQSVSWTRGEVIAR